MTLFVDTSVWSLAFRRDVVSPASEVTALRQALEGGRGRCYHGADFAGTVARLRGTACAKDIIERFAALPLLNPDRQDYIDAAELRNRCRRAGLQMGTIDALLPSSACATR